MACATTAALLSASTNTFVAVLALGGYRTAAIGKSHLRPFTDLPPKWEDDFESGPIADAWKSDGLYPRPRDRISERSRRRRRSLPRLRLLSPIRTTRSIRRAAIGTCIRRTISRSGCPTKRTGTRPRRCAGCTRTGSRAENSFRRKWPSCWTTSRFARPWRSPPA